MICDKKMYFSSLTQWCITVFHKPLNAMKVNEESTTGSLLACFPHKTPKRKLRLDNRDKAMWLKA